MFTQEDCIPQSHIHSNYETQVLVLNPNHLTLEYRKKEFQLWKATGGFGCKPKNLGTAVFSTCLADGEPTRWERYDFLGVVKPEVLAAFTAANPDLLAKVLDPQ